MNGKPFYRAALGRFNLPSGFSLGIRPGDCDRNACGDYQQLCQWSDDPYEVTFVTDVLKPWYYLAKLPEHSGIPI